MTGCVDGSRIHAGLGRTVRAACLLAVLAAGAVAEEPRARRAAVEARGLTPAAAAAAMTLPPGFSVRLLAAEPDVRQLIAMAFDDRGRLWVAEAYSYPQRVADADRVPLNAGIWRYHPVRREIEDRHLSEKSLMPENQLALLPFEDARDLVAYLRSPTQVPLPAPPADRSGP